MKHKSIIVLAFAGLAMISCGGNNRPSDPRKSNK